MREIQSYDGFERALKASKTPIINPESVKAGVHEYAQMHNSKNLSRKVMTILVAIVILSLGTAVLGDTLKNVLYNKKGEKIYEYGIPSAAIDEQKEASRMNKYKSLLDELHKETKLGECAFLIIPEEYKIDGTYFEVQDMKPIYNIDDIKNCTTTKFRSPVSKDITFKDGTIYFKTISKNSTENFFDSLDKKYKEAVDKGLEYITWTEPVGKEANTINLKYIINKFYNQGKYIQVNSTLLLSISRAKGQVTGIAPLNNVSKVKIGDSEGIFVDTAKPEIIYIDDSTGESLTYHFYYKDPSLKDTIVSLIENMQ